MTTKQLAMPEWLTRRDTAGGAWTIEEGQPVRGDAWTALLERRMRIPTGDDPASRVVRGHEMVHAKVSPTNLYTDRRYGATTESLIVAEEYRVNYLLEKAGFDIDELSDGSEHRSGEITGQNKDWNGAIRFLTAISGTKAATAYIRGVSKHNPAMAESLKAFQKELKKAFRKAVRECRETHLASTIETSAYWNDEHFTYPRGFQATIALAQFIDKFIISDDADKEEAAIPAPEQIKPTSGAHGRFAALNLLTLPMPRRVDGKIGRKRIATNIGYNPRRIDRMLTDPEKRVFDRRTKGKGGVVLIDQSGSMHFSEDDLNEIVAAAPGCVVIGYSHRQGSNEPNTWVIADRGKLAESIPIGGRGNGVDGPAIKFAAKHVRTGEPLIWVCDGLVTDGDEDKVYDNLTEEAAGLVVKHRVHMVPDVQGAVAALTKAARGERLSANAVGRIQYADAWRRRQA
jgi:hypothetical protein